MTKFDPTARASELYPSAIITGTDARERALQLVRETVEAMDADADSRGYAKFGAVRELIRSYLPAPPAPASREARLEKALREIRDRIARNDASHLGIEGIARHALEGDE